MSKPAVVVIVIISLLFGFAIGFWWGGKDARQISEISEGNEVSNLSEATPSFINGIVKEVRGNTVVVESSPPVGFVGEWPTTKEVKVVRGITDLQGIEIGSLVVIETERDVTGLASFEAVRIRDSKSGEVLAGLPLE